MYALRGVAVSFSVFVMVYCALSVAVCLAWRTLWMHSQHYPARRIADTLFALRMVPLAAAAVITAAFTVPSFILLEPRAIQEPLGGIPLVLGIVGAGLTLYGLANAAMALRQTALTVSTWTTGAQPVNECSSVPVLRIPRAVPAMTAAGIIRPQVLMSGVAEFLLTGNELKTALNHEVEHVRRRDNLKKLLLRLVSFPGMTGLEAAWRETIEMAADDAAVSSAGEALDLAAALIKLSRFGPAESGADLTAALVHRPLSAMNARVTRLIAWSEDRLVSPDERSPWYDIGVAVAVFAAFAVTYGQLLVRVHTATEWLVR